MGSMIGKIKQMNKLDIRVQLMYKKIPLSIDTKKLSKKELIELYKKYEYKPAKYT
jgi:hypothetical protein